jgi:hypothetical protein
VAFCVVPAHGVGATATFLVLSHFVDHTTKMSETNYDIDFLFATRARTETMVSSIHDWVYVALDGFIQVVWDEAQSP